MREREKEGKGEGERKRDRERMSHTLIIHCIMYISHLTENFIICLSKNIVQVLGSFKVMEFFVYSMFHGKYNLYKATKIFTHLKF